MEPLFVGVDMGTSSVKVLLTDRQGRRIADASEAYMPVSPRPDWMEMDPECWYTAAVRGIRRVLAQADPARVRGLCCTGQMHSLTLLDRQDRVIRPAILWNDGRAVDVCARARAELAVQPGLETLAELISNGSPAASLLWLKENEPETFARIDCFLMGSDALTWRLCGQRVTDWCEASVSGLFDAKRNAWSPEMRALVGLRQEQYPALFGSACPAGTLCAQAAADLGLSRSVTVAVGTGDNPAATYATGSLAQGFPTVSIGTAGVLVIPQRTYQPCHGFKNVLFSPDGEKVHSLLQGVVQSAGGSLQWWTRDILRLSDYAGIDRAIDPDALFRPQLLFYPHLVGDKAVHYAPDLRGAFLGLSTDTDREQLTLAVLEGVCFGIRELLSLAYQPLGNAEMLRVTGGGSRSVVWMQVLADVLNMPVVQLDSRAGAACGAALLAARACGEAPADPIGTAPALRVFVPRPAFTARYAEKYERYGRVYAAFQRIYEENAPVAAPFPDQFQA